MRSDEHGRIRNPAMRLAHVCGIAPFFDANLFSIDVNEVAAASNFL